MNASNHKHALNLILLLFAAISGWGFLILEKMQITITIGTPDVTLVGTPTASSFTSAVPSEPNLVVFTPTSLPTTISTFTATPIVLLPTQSDAAEPLSPDQAPTNVASNSQTNHSVSGNNPSDDGDIPDYIPPPMPDYPVLLGPTPVMPTPIPAVIIPPEEKPTEVLPPVVKETPVEATPKPFCAACIAE
jgi:hypothetical protein